MKTLKTQLVRAFTLVAVLSGLMGWLTYPGSLLGQTNPPSPIYHIYAGNTHSHTVYTWSHGDQFIAAKKTSNEKKVPDISVSPEGVQSPSKLQTTKPDWQ